MRVASRLARRISSAQVGQHRFGPGETAGKLKLLGVVGLQRLVPETTG